MMKALDFPLCDQVVTIYRQTEGGIWRQVVMDVFYHFQDVLSDDGGLQRRFLLVVPGTELTLQPGDRVFPGKGPQVDMSGWKSFVPAAVPGLSRVAYVKRYPTHTEAGYRSMDN